MGIIWGLYDDYMGIEDYMGIIYIHGINETTPNNSKQRQTTNNGNKIEIKKQHQQEKANKQQTM